MIKCSELQLGDWVMCDKGFPSQITEIKDLGEVKELSPLEISESILKLNDFEEIPVGNRRLFRYTDKRACVEIYLELGLIRVSTLCTNNTLYDNEIKYVHELQHVFRMLKIGNWHLGVDARNFIVM